jgi:outer membrane protein OmpA-like peptidoglycan-associated protein
MSIKVLIAGMATLMCAIPAAAQERGTVEFGAFGSAATFDNSLSLTSGYGGGGRVGIFLNPRLSMEFEDAEMRASRPNGLNSVNVGILSGRLVAAPVKVGAVSFLIGGGAGVSTETNFMHSYGVDGLVGAKLALTDNAALRVDGVWDWLANQNWKTYKSVRVGVSLYRHPARRQSVAMIPAPAPMIAHTDSVSAAETRRLRDSDAELNSLRDSLRNSPVRAPVPVSATNAETMQATIHFAFDKSELTDSARAILDEKVELFRANPQMSVMIVGYTDRFGSSAYNVALGAQRANAAKSYIVTHGVNASRVLVESQGERHPVTEASGIAGQAPNRRAVFRLQVGPDVGTNK